MSKFVIVLEDTEDGCKMTHQTIGDGKTPSDESKAIHYGNMVIDTFKQIQRKHGRKVDEKGRPVDEFADEFPEDSQTETGQQPTA